MGPAPKQRVCHHVDWTGVGSCLVAGARISSFGVIVLIPAPRVAPELPSQPSALIWVEGPWPAAGGAAGGTLLSLESAFTDGKAAVSASAGEPSADPAQDSVGASCTGGRNALKWMLVWGSPLTSFGDPFGILNSKVCANQNGLLKG